MAEYQVNRLSLTVWFATIGLGVVALMQTSEPIVAILVGAVVHQRRPDRHRPGSER